MGFSGNHTAGQEEMRFVAGTCVCVSWPAVFCLFPTCLPVQRGLSDPYAPRGDLPSLPKSMHRLPSTFPQSIFHQSLCPLPVYFFSVYASTSVLSFRSLYIRFWSVCLSLIYAFIPRLFSLSPCVYFRSNLSPCTNFRSNLLQSIHQLPV